MGSSRKKKERHKKVRKQLVLERQLAKHRAKHPSIPRVITGRYKDPNTLVTIGAILKASWSVPKALEDALNQASRPIPPPVHGYMLIDTGARATCMAADVTRDLQLQPIRLQDTYGAGGLHSNEVFEALLAISIADKAGNQISVNGEIQAMSIPQLDEVFQRLNVQTSDPFPSRLVGLVGRDLLRHGTFTYWGSKGEFEFRLDLASFQQTIV